MKHSYLLFLASILCSTVCNAESLDVAYKSFYSHVRKLQQEDTDKLQFAFGFVNINTQRLCHLHSAAIVTPKKTIALAVSNEQRFLVPSEKALNLADAVVRIDFQEPSNQCDMSVQLETKPELLKTHYTQQELKQIELQYTAFFNEMGSFLSFLMPTVKGLMIHFEDESLSAEVSKGSYIQNGILLLDDSKIAKLDNLSLPAKPLRITALSSR